jgi:hypothetical protein
MAALLRVQAFGAARAGSRSSVCFGVAAAAVLTSVGFLPPTRMPPLMVLTANIAFTSASSRTALETGL